MREDLSAAAAKPLLDELGLHAGGTLVEWTSTGGSLLAALMGWCEALRSGEDLATLLREAASAPLDGSDDTGPAAACLLLPDPSLAGDVLAVVRRASSRLAAGGSLVLSLGAGVDLDARTERWRRTLDDAPELELRAIRRVEGRTLLVARRRGRLPRIALLPDGAGACLQIRTLGPLEWLESRGKIELCVLPREAGARDLADKDLLLLQRFGGLPAATRMLEARRMGVPVALELDDDFFNLPWYNPGAADFDRREVRVVLRALLRGADAVVTSTPYLKRQMERHNANVHCMHNVVDTSLFVRRESPFAEPGVTTFGYIGTRTHEEDLRPILPALRRLILEGNGRVRAVFIGHVPDALRRLPGVRYAGWFAAYHNAAAALARSGANVALAPLKDVEFNRSKSAMKYLEYGACGIAGLFSDVEAYRGFIRDGENGFLVPEHTTAAWEAAMRGVIECPHERERVSEAAWRDVSEHHSIERRADEFLDLYLRIIDAARAAMPVDAEDVDVAPLAASRAEGPALVLGLESEPERALTRMAALADRIRKDAPVTVVSGRPELMRLLRVAGEPPVVPVTPAEPLRGNGVAEAVGRSGAGLVLYVDERADVPDEILDRLAAHAGPGVGAVGPRILEEGSEQCVSAVTSGTLHGADLREALLAHAADHPSTEVPWLDPHCVLIDVAAVREAGGIDPEMTWEDALCDLCLRLRRHGCKVLAANDVHVRVARMGGRGTDAETLRRSRSRLAGRWSTHDVRSAAGRLEDPARIHGLGGESLDVWVVARPGSPYLRECLRRIERHAGIPHRLHVVHPPGDEEAERSVALAGGRVVPRPVSEPGFPADEVLGGTDRTHALILHDGVMVTPGAVREMLDVALLGERPVVAPFANDGSPGQRMVIGRGVSLGEIDTFMSQRVSERSERLRTLDRCGGFCVLVDAGRLRAAGGPASLEELTGRTRPARILHAARAYVHVLNHPSPTPDPAMGAWPGGPFDIDLPDAAEALAGLEDFLGRIRPLLAALKENPGDARILAHIGLLYLGRGDLQNALSFLGRAGKLDPFSPRVAEAARRVRSMLDAGAV